MTHLRVHRLWLPCLMIIALTATGCGPKNKVCKRFMELAKQEGQELPSSIVKDCDKMATRLSKKASAMKCLEPCVEAAKKSVEVTLCFGKCDPRMAKRKKAGSSFDSKEPRPIAVLSGTRARGKELRKVSFYGLFRSRTLKFDEQMNTELTFYSNYKGQTIEVGQHKVAMGDSHRVKLKLELKPLLFKALKRRGTIKPGIISLPALALPAKITASNGKSRKGELKVGISSLFERWFLDTARKGKALLLPGEEVSKNKKRSLIFIGVRSRVLMGQAATFEEVDMVGFYAYGKDRIKHCGTYINRATGRKRRVSISLTDKIAKVQDRRTGKLIKKKVFRARKRCPRKTRRPNNEGGFASNKKIKAWMKKQLAR